MKISLFLIALSLSGLYCHDLTAGCKDAAFSDPSLQKFVTELVAQGEILSTERDSVIVSHARPFFGRYEDYPLIVVKADASYPENHPKMKRSFVSKLRRDGGYFIFDPKNGDAIPIVELMLGSSGKYHNEIIIHLSSVNEQVQIRSDQNRRNEFQFFQYPVVPSERLSELGPNERLIAQFYVDQRGFVAKDFFEALSARPAYAVKTKVNQRPVLALATNRPWTSPLGQWHVVYHPTTRHPIHVSELADDSVELPEHTIYFDRTPEGVKVRKSPHADF